MDIPTQLIYEAVVTLGTAIGIAIIGYLRALLKEVKTLSCNNKKLEKNIYMIAMVISQCKACPHPDLKFLNELDVDTDETGIGSTD